ncbi:MAG TPA: phospholipid carrier-dependent glycosyltransferase [Blastocatellia bacterium]|jgi:hypothetical protein|nr:phospholipid carrier-dependent glycosyltransferase [Blastocatellia bacterium]
MTKRRIVLLDAAGLFGIALLLRAVVLALFPFDGLYGQDAFAYYDYAGVLRTALEHGHTPPPFFWPIGYPLHIVATSWIVGMKPLAGQLASLMAGSLVAAFTYALVREVMFDFEARRARRAAVVAALIVAVTGQSIISSISTMADATALVWATASAWLTIRYARTMRPGWLALAAISLGLAVVTRWGNSLLAVPWVLGVLLAWRRQWLTVGWIRPLASGGLAILVGGIVVGLQLASGSHTGDLQVYTWNPLHAVQSTLTNADGTFNYELPMGLFYAQPLLHPSYLFPLFAPFWIVGLWSLGRVGEPARALLVGWPLIVYLFLIGVTWQNPRFALACFPPLAAWTGLGLDALLERRVRWRTAASVFMIVALVGAYAWSLRAVRRFGTEMKTVPLEHVQFLVSQLPARVPVISFGLTHTIEHYSDLQVSDIFLETQESLQERVCGNRDLVYVYLNLDNVGKQWQGKAPDQNYRWLREQPGLEEVGRFKGYTLFRVGRGCASAPD